MALRAAVVAVAAGIGLGWPLGAAEPDASRLRAPAEFAGIKDRQERSRALFAEASRVIFHPRCLNCHPPDDHPRQGDAQTVHDPPVFRGAGDNGVPAMHCATCHQDRNLAHARVPGVPAWRLAPVEMAWLGRTPAFVCRQLQDKARNGNRTLDDIWEHSAHDPLVAWGWAPGHDRTKAPGTQERFAELIRAWIDTGAACPPAEAAR